MKRIFCGLSALLLLSGCSMIPTSTNEPTATVVPVENADMSGYTNLEDSNFFLSISYDEYMEAVSGNSKNMIVYMGTPNCHYCQDAVVELQKTAEQFSTNVFVLNLDELSTEEFDAVKETLRGFMKTDENGEEMVYTPHVVTIKKGKIEGSKVGFESGDTYNELFELLMTIE